MDFIDLSSIKKIIWQFQLQNEEKQDTGYHLDIFRSPTLLKMLLKKIKALLLKYKKTSSDAQVFQFKIIRPDVSFWHVTYVY